jgi:hypothetical protein
MLLDRHIADNLRVAACGFSAYSVPSALSPLREPSYSGRLGQRLSSLIFVPNPNGHCSLLQ